MLPTITIDIGTTSVKLCVLDAEGGMVVNSAVATPVVPDEWGAVYDVDVLVGLVRSFIQGVDARVRGTVSRISITGVGESGGLVRSDVTLASPMILWHDHRGASLLESLSARDTATIYRVTGLPVNANYGLSKVAWALTHSADGHLGNARWLNISEYLAAVFTGDLWSEYSLASRTMALDLASRDWSAEVCGLLGVPTSAFPVIRPATSGAPISADVARSLGLSDEVAVHVAGHDHMVGAAGAALTSNELLNSTGTTEGLLFLRDAPDCSVRAQEAKLANGIETTGFRFTVFASIPTGGSAFGTLQSLLGLSATELRSRISALSDRWRAGSVNLDRVPLVLPQFRGAPPPTKDSSARGVISGIRTDTTIDELIFGCFLGQVLQFREVLDLFGQEPSTVKVIGPGSRDPLWLQLKADLMGIPLSVSSFPEVVSRGAQVLASGESLGWDACEPRAVVPDDECTRALREWHERVRDQLSALKKLAS